MTYEFKTWDELVKKGKIYSGSDPKLETLFTWLYILTEEDNTFTKFVHSSGLEISKTDSYVFECRHNGKSYQIEAVLYPNGRAGKPTSNPITTLNVRVNGCNAIQLSLDDFTTVKAEGTYEVWHNGLQSQVKAKDVLAKVKEKNNHKITKNNGKEIIIIGDLDLNSNTYSVTSDIQDFLGNLFNYAILRCEIK